MKILLADPEPESRDAMRRAFAGAGDQVRGVATLSEAARQLPDLAPDAVVASLDFPESEVFRFFEEALRLDPKRALYALVDSTRLEEGVSAMARGAHGFLWRPVSPGRVALLRSRLAARREQESGIEQMRVNLARAEIEIGRASCREGV